MSDAERIVIVGGGPAGLVILCAEEHHPYSRPPLTKGYLRSEHGRGELFLEQAVFYAGRRIDLRLGCAAARVDPAAKAVVTDAGEELPFAARVLATGSEPMRLPVPGGDGDDLLTLRAIEDSERLQSQCAPGVRVTVVGSGLIGCEAVASIAMRGCEVTLVSDEDAPQAGRLGNEVGAILAGWLEQAGVRTLSAPGSRASARTAARSRSATTRSSARSRSWPPA